MQNSRPSRKERRAKQQQENRQEHQPQNFKLIDISPKTDNQRLAFEYYDKNKNLLLHGVPGSGKSFISLFLALEDVFSKNSPYEKVVIIRSAQASKGIGFLPGTAKQKMEVFEAPYIAICTKLFNRADAYSILKQKGIIEFESTSFLRGTTIDNAVIILDEIQNLSFQEQKTVLTRVGQDSRLIMCGDLNQDDLTSERYSEESGLKKMMHILNKIASVATVEFSVADIVRSGFVREFVIAELDTWGYFNHETKAVRSQPLTPAYT